jgi:eukaryotic-like serine/threonine-protein kinase
MIGQTISHYRVLEEIGAGGMGVVYRAEDLRLGRTVALKMLPAHLVRDPAALLRFEREARLASALTHPHICTIHDLGEHDGQPFLVMEFLEGRVLSQVIGEKPLPLAHLLDLALQVGQALEAAHRRGIIHRDLKPGNVLVMDGHLAKVLDFGLATLAHSATSVTRSPADDVSSPTRATDVGAGTTAYMSPEQARGERLDPRTDLFSFGAMLYEMATGARAFPGPTMAVVFDGVLNRMPIAPTHLNPEIPPGLEQVIQKALEKDRNLRYQGASDLLADLRRIKRRLDHPSGAALVASEAAPAWSTWSAPTPARGAGSRRRRMVAGLLALACVVVAAALLLRWRAEPAPLTDRDSVLLADFDNRTGDPVFDGTLREALAVHLSQSPFLDVVPTERVRETLQMMGQPANAPLTSAVAREVCQRQGVKAMLQGSVARLGTAYVLTLEASDCLQGEFLAREQVQVERKEDVVGALGTSSRSLRRRLGESLATLERFDVPIEQATTGSIDALRAYALGVAERAAGTDIDAIPFFRRAAEIDPTFASAYNALSSIYGSLGESDRREEYARLAYDHRAHVTERERLFIEYQYHDAVTGDEMRALEILQVWKQSYPRDYRPANALAVLFNRVGQYTRAIEEATEARRRNPDHPFPYSNLAFAYRGANRYAEARQAAGEALKRGIETVPTRRLLFQLALLEGVEGEAAEHLAWARNRAREFDLIGAQAQAMAHAGRMAEARELYRGTAERAERQGFPQIALGYQAQLAWTEALYGERDRAIEQATHILSRQPTVAPRLRAAAALALAGAASEAERLLEGEAAEATTDTFRRDVYGPLARAAVHLARGQHERAVEALRPATAYETGSVAALAPLFLRGEALLPEAPGHAAAQFRGVLDHRGVDPFSPLLPLARLGLARALARQGDVEGSRIAYGALLREWADADPDLPPLREARVEHGALR